MTPDDVYPFDDVHEAARHVLHSTSPTFLNLQAPVASPMYSAPPVVPIVAPNVTTIKTEDLSMMFERFASTLVKALQPASTSTQPAQNRKPANSERDMDHCNFCGETGHYIGACRHVTSYIAEGKVKRDVYGKVVLSSGARVPSNIPGKWLRERVDEWHRRNPNQLAVVEVVARNTPQQLMYEIQDESTSTYHFSSDDRIATLEQEIFALHSKQVFDGVEVPRRRIGPPNRKANDAQPVQTEAPPQTPTPAAETTKKAPKPDKLASQDIHPPPANPEVTKKGDAPLHPFKNIRKPVYAPPHERNFAALPPRLGKDKDNAYRSVAPVQDPNIAEDVYKQSMNTPCITLSHKELYSLSPEVRQHIRDAVTPKRIINQGTCETKKVAIEEVIDEDDPFPFPDAQDHDADAVIIPDPYETYLSTLKPGQLPDRLTSRKGFACAAFHIFGCRRHGTSRIHHRSWFANHRDERSSLSRPRTRLQPERSS